jgi:uncharacterized membrane protein (UPF0182 family)
MSPRALRIASVVLVLGALLFAGRWTAGLLAEHWWASQLSSHAAGFVTHWAALSLLIEGTGILLACAWFVGHLLLVYQAIGSVQVHRRVGNLEIREAVNMRAIVWLSISAGLLLGVIVGRGTGEWTPLVMLAWAGVRYGEVDPVLGRELGFYIARLPLWRVFQDFALLLTCTALVGSAILYVVIGALRWVDRRPAINDHARRHLGVLAGLVALALAWQYLLRPYEIVGGVSGTVHEGLFEFRRNVALALTGTSLAASVLSFLWALRGHNTLLLAIWCLLAGTSLFGGFVIPTLLGPTTTSVMEPATRRQLDQLAYGMDAARDSTLTRRDVPPDPPRPAGLWQPVLAVDATAGDSGRVVTVDRAVVQVGRRPRPAWLVVRDKAEQGASVVVLLDDQTTITGRPILFHDSDSLRTAGGTPALRLPRRGIWPRAPGTVVDTVSGGVEIGSGLRRLALAWALQSGRLLGPVSPGERVYWHLDPVERLSRLAPFAVWGAPSPRFIGGELVWLVDGYLPSESFPGSSRVRWRGEWVGALRAGFVGVVRAQSGTTSIYLRHTADELAKAWQAITDSLIEPSSAVPAEIVRALPYPAELMEAQARVLSNPHWGLGQVLGRAPAIGLTGPAEEGMWEPDTSGVQINLPFGRPPQRQISAVVSGHVSDGWEMLTLFRLDSLLSLPDPAALQAKWARFPTFQQIKDSVEKEGARLEPGPVRYWPTSTGLGAVQAQFARREGQEPTLAWISLAIGDRRGAGHDLEEAWQNLLGLSAPIISAGDRGSQLLEARRHMQAAETALRRGDLEAFGRAWEALRRVLQIP